MSSLPPGAVPMNVSETPVEQLLDSQWRNYDASQRPESFVSKEITQGGWKIASGRDIGEKKLDSTRGNEDKVAIDRVVVEKDGIKQENGETLLILADGMGGHANGKQARDIARAKISESYMFHRASLSPEKALEQAIKEANQAILEYNSDKNTDSGAAIVVGIIDDNGNYTVANVGDSRAYIANAKGARQVSQDHSLVANLVQIGVIEPQDVYTHPMKSNLYRSLGSRHAEPYISSGVLQNGEQLLLCSDGLWEMTKDADGSEIKRFARSSNDQGEVVRRLLARANQGGGEDNISVIVARRIAESVPVSNNIDPQEAIPEQKVQGTYYHEGDIIVITRSDGRRENGWIVTKVDPVKQEVIAESPDRQLKKENIPIYLLQQISPRTMEDVQDIDGLEYYLSTIPGLQSSLGFQTSHDLISYAQRYLRGELNAEQLTTAGGFRQKMEELKLIMDTRKSLQELIPPGQGNQPLQVKLKQNKSFIGKVLAGIGGN